MPQRRRMAVLAAALALLAAGPAAPAALGQSAGDDQYEDPFAGEDAGGSGGDEEPAPEAPAPPQEEPAPSAPEPAADTPPAAEPASSQQPELARTGLDPAPILAAGAVLLAGGIALRVRLRERS